MVAVRTGLVLGILVVLWTFVMGFTGWYRHPSLLFTLVVFPSYFAEMEALGRLRMTQQGFTAEQIEAVMKAGGPMQTTLGRAFAWALGTWITGLFTSVVAAVWYHKRAVPPVASPVQDAAGSSSRLNESSHPE